jgi:hypothetical protein
MLSSDQKHTMHQIDAFDITQNLQLWAVYIFELCSGYFRADRLARHATKDCESSGSNCTGHP